MKDWFLGLESREQQFVSVGVVIVVVAILYGLIWAPLAKKQAQLQQDIARWDRSISDLRPLSGVLSSAATSNNAQTSPTPTQTPLIAVDQTLRARGLDQYRRNSQPTSSNGIRVTFENVAFDDLMIWLGDVSQQHGLNVQNGSFTTGSSSAQGRINATLSLERSL